MRAVWHPATVAARPGWTESTLHGHPSPHKDKDPRTSRSYPQAAARSRPTPKTATPTVSISPPAWTRIKIGRSRPIAFCEVAIRVLCFSPEGSVG